MKLAQEPRRNFRYAFDNDGYYAGLVRADRATGLPVFPALSTEQEPYWKAGFRPRFSFELNSWTLEPRGEKELRLAVEKEVMQKYFDKYCARLSETEKVFDLIANVIIDRVRAHGSLTDSHVEKLLHSVENRIDLKGRIYQNHVTERFNHIEKMIDNLAVQLEYTIQEALAPQPNIFIRLWTWIKSKFPNK